jgi:Fe-S cluster biogenesis protein NfuA/nitrite reductase/ring-hydroxylating ferredoxin subunit
VRPYLASHGGSVVLLDVSPEGTVKLRLEGSCHGCASSAMTLKYAIEQAIMEAAPDVAGIEVEGVVEPPPRPAGFVPLTQIKGVTEPTRAADPWEPVAGLESLGRGTAGTREVAGSRIVFCQVDGAWYAYADRCPRCGDSFDGAPAQSAVLACPGCGLRFEVRRAGRCLDAPELHLEPVPLLEKAGQVRVAAAAGTG